MGWKHGMCMCKLMKMVCLLILFQVPKLAPALHPKSMQQKQSARMNETYFFMHVPKSGGTMFRFEAPRFLELRKCPLHGCCKNTAKVRHQVGMTVSLMQEQKCNFADYEASIDMFNHGVLNPLGQMHKLIVLRKPFLHFISQLEHDMRHHNRYRSLDEKVSTIRQYRWNDWKSRRGGYKLKNPQWQRVVGSLGENASVWRTWDYLQSTFHSVGLQEHMDLTLCVFYFNIHRTLPPACCMYTSRVTPVRNAAKKPQQKSHQLRSEQLRQASSWLQLDDILYSAAQSLFWRNVKGIAREVPDCPAFQQYTKERALSNVAI